MARAPGSSHVQLGRAHGGPGRLDACVDIIAHLRQEVLGPRAVVVRLVDGKRRIATRGHGVLDRGGRGPGASPRFLDRGRAGVTSAASVGHAIRRHELALEERLDTAQVIVRVVGLCLQSGHGRFGRRSLSRTRELRVADARPASRRPISDAADAIDFRCASTSLRASARSARPEPVAPHRDGSRWQRGDLLLHVLVVGDPQSTMDRSPEARSR